MHEDLMIVAFAEGTDVVADRVAGRRVERLDAHYLEAGEWRRARLRGDHAAEASHTPRAHMKRLGAHRHQMLLGQHHLQNGAAMHRKALFFVCVFSFKKKLT